MACELFGFSQSELIGVNLSDLLTLKPKQPEAIMESHLEDTGEIVEIHGQVVSRKASMISEKQKYMNSGTPS